MRVGPRVTANNVTFCHTECDLQAPCLEAGTCLEKSKVILLFVWVYSTGVHMY